MFSSQGEKTSFKNDNIIIKDKSGNTKYQISCYRVFSLMIVGEVSITSGLIQRAKKFGFTIVLFTRGFKVYSVIGTRMEGNILLHRKQYAYDTDELANFIVLNKLKNQKDTINLIRNKNEANKEAVKKIDAYIDACRNYDLSKKSLLGIEGSAARVYFSQVFNNTQWQGRKPRVKNDYVNASLDIGYTILFNMVDALLQIYGFDVYYGIYHKEFYMRKSLVCDLMEPMRPIIDWTVRKAVNLKQIQKEDFEIFNNRYVLKYEHNPKYVEIFLKALLDNKNKMFLFVQNYYRCFMKNKEANKFQEFRI